MIELNELYNFAYELIARYKSHDAQFYDFGEEVDIDNSISFSGSAA